MTVQTETPEAKIERTHISSSGLQTSRVALGTWAAVAALVIGIGL